MLVSNFCPEDEKRTWRLLHHDQSHPLSGRSTGKQLHFLTLITPRNRRTRDKVSGFPFQLQLTCGFP